MFIIEEELNASLIPGENCGNTGILFLEFINFGLVFLSTSNAVVKYSQIIGSIHAHAYLTHTPFFHRIWELLKNNWLSSWLNVYPFRPPVLLHIPPSSVMTPFRESRWTILTTKLFIKPITLYLHDLLEIWYNLVLELETILGTLVIQKRSITDQSRT